MDAFAVETESFERSVRGMSLTKVAEQFRSLFSKPVAENGFLQLDDNTPGLGLTLKTEFLDQFNIIG